MSFCLPVEQVNKFVQALKSGMLNPETLDAMSSADRHAMFAKLVGEDDAAQVNALIESKLLLKNQERGLINAVKKIIGENKPASRDLLTKIQNMDKILSPADKQSFMADLAAKKLGTEVNFEEAQNITQLAKKVQDAKDSGATTFSGVSDEYLKAKNDLTDYVGSLKPVSSGAAIAKDLVTIGRNNLLLNPSTLIKTSAGQFVNSVIEGISRRISTLSIKGTSGDLASAANKEAWATFNKTGVNVAGMENVNDTHVMGKGEPSFKTSTGETVGSKAATAIETGVRKVAQLSNKIAIDWQHVKPFTKVYQKAFYDMNNILASDIAKREGLKGSPLKARSDAIFYDASKIEPQTTEGKMVRSQAQEQAARVTSTNETYASHFALGVKKLLNKVGTPIGVPLGDLIIPIAKIPATIFANGIENAGAGLFTGAKDAFEGYKKISSDNLSTRYEGMGQFQKGIQTLGRTVGTMGLAMYVASKFTKNDFKTDAYGAHYVRIGNTWINMEYMSAVSPALAGAMMAKTGSNGLDSAYKYGAGALSSFKSVPGVDELNQLATTGAKKYAQNFIQQRTTPTIIQNMFKDRPINRLFFGSTGVETTQQVKADDVAKAKTAAATRKANARAKRASH